MKNKKSEIINDTSSSYIAAANNIFIQRSIAIGSVNDPLEHEAVAMADKVMRMPEPNLIQRKCTTCDEDEKVQRRPLVSSITPFIQSKGIEGSNVSESLTQKIDSTKGKGNSLDNETKSFMENRFGTDFSDVKIHNDGNAKQMSKEINAQAFTYGKDIYFNSGMYSPESESGKRLLAHELTHVVHQNNTEKSFINTYYIQRVQSPTENYPEPTFNWPVIITGSQITSLYGQRKDGFHPGIDISQKINTPVYAAASGTVIYAGPVKGYGSNFVAIKHNDSLVSSYGHMNSMTVKLNQKVNQRQQIGTVGNQGISFGPHLHFNVITDKRKILIGNIFNGDIDPLNKGLTIPIGVQILSNNEWSFVPPVSVKRTVKEIQIIVGVNPDGVYGIITKTAVEKYQGKLKNEGFYEDAIDGKWGSNTENAYNSYFKKTVSPHSTNKLKLDSKIDFDLVARPDTIELKNAKGSEKSIVSTSSNTKTETEKVKLESTEIKTNIGIEDVIAAALKDGDPHPNIVGAQWALESGWGKYQSGKYNYFGIKGSPGTLRNTWEVVDGKKIQIKAFFRDYNSLEDGIMARVELLKKPLYKEYYSAKTDEEAAKALSNAGYATDPDYSEKLISILRIKGTSSKSIVSSKEKKSEKSTIDVKPAVKQILKGKIISFSVGKNGINNAYDVFKIKELLNNAGFPAGTGYISDDKLYTAIISFQKNYFKWTADGIIEPGKDTEAKLLELKYAKLKSTKPKTINVNKTSENKTKAHINILNYYYLYENNEISMPQLAKNLKAYAETYDDEIISIIDDKLAFYEKDNFCYALANNSSDSELNKFSNALLSKMRDSLDTFWTHESTSELIQRQRIFSIIESKNKIVGSIAYKDKKGIKLTAEEYKIGEEMLENTKYYIGYAYIPFEGPITHHKYKVGEKIDPKDALKFYKGNPTWCNQFAMDFVKKITKISPFAELKQGYTTATNLWEFMSKRTDKFSLLKTFKQAWNDIKLGNLILFSTIDHIAIGYPTESNDMKMPDLKYNLSSDWKFGKIIQAGHDTGILYLNKAWPGSRFLEIKIFKCLSI